MLTLRSALWYESHEFAEVYIYGFYGFRETIK